MSGASTKSRNSAPFPPLAIAERLQNWWEFGDQKTPCILATLAPQRPSEPTNTDLLDYWTDIDTVMTREMARIDQTRWLGESVPFHYIDLGASAMPVLLGAQAEFIDTETIWAHPVFENPEQVLNCRLDEIDPLYRTMLELARRSAETAPGHHMVAPYALGGILDNLLGLCGAESTLIELLERPSRVHPALEYLKRIWIEAFVHLQDLLGQAHPDSGIGWAGIWAPGTTFPLQEDCSYMLSPDCFREFCLPHLRDLIDLLDYPLYHLDGSAALVHLPTLLQIDSLKAIQWQPGAGKESIAQWIDMIRTVLEHGKSLQLFARPEEIDDLVEAVGARGLLISCPDIDIEQAEKLADRYPDVFL
ncbi:hypothetical protein JW992_13685 [candidate division KSB1 bacterium]|nr:hypothetical protein [candidate division KSB1 bacterium]